MGYFNFINIEEVFRGEISLGGLFRGLLGNKKVSKSNAHILFIDDKDFPVVQNLREAGWSTERIKDIRNLDQDNVQRAHIIFVDYRGVGKYLAENDEGFGLIKALKRKYEDSKRIILYSEYGRYKSDFITKAKEYADNHLPKDSNTEEFISMIESELKEL